MTGETTAYLVLTSAVIYIIQAQSFISYSCNTTFGQHSVEGCTYWVQTGNDPDTALFGCCESSNSTGTYIQCAVGGKICCLGETFIGGYLSEGSSLEFTGTTASPITKHISTATVGTRSMSTASQHNRETLPWRSPPTTKNSGVLYTSFKQKRRKPINVWELAGAVLGCVVSLIVIITAIVACCRCRRGRYRAEDIPLPVLE